VLVVDVAVLVVEDVSVLVVVDVTVLVVVDVADVVVVLVTVLVVEVVIDVVVDVVGLCVHRVQSGLQASRFDLSTIGISFWSDACQSFSRPNVS
jgi:hypothetical protein